MMHTQTGGFCIHCGNWIDGGERCDCAAVSGPHWGGGGADQASPGQEDAIRWLEEALSLVDWDSPLGR